MTRARRYRWTHVDFGEWRCGDLVVVYFRHWHDWSAAIEGGGCRAWLRTSKGRMSVFKSRQAAQRAAERAAGKGGANG